VRLRPPIRFPLAVVGTWVLLRAAVLIPDWGTEPLRAPTRPFRNAISSVGAAPLEQPVLAAPRVATPKPRRIVRRTDQAAADPPQTLSRPARPAAFAELHASSAAPLLAGVPPVPATVSGSRWTLSAWAFVRPGDAASLAPAGTLGGSQIGARTTYRLKPGLTASLRLYAPLSSPRAAEAAAGLDWQPLRRVPVRLLAERRQALGPEGRSAWSVMAYGGVDAIKAGPFRIDAYGEAGVVGARRRDLFADGAARLTLPAGRLRLGAGVWGAAQPGVSRLDAGPHVEARLGPASLSADWRFRLAGHARPGSGPAITLSTGF
jgi:hypothetical protein